MQAAIAEAADVRPLLHLCVNASLFATIAGSNQPDPAEIGGKDPDDPVGNDLELDVKRGRREKGTLKLTDALLPAENTQSLLLHPLFLGDIPDRGLDDALSRNLHPAQKDDGGKRLAIDSGMSPLECMGAVAQGRFDHFLGLFG